MTERMKKRTIDLNPYDVRDETVRELKREVTAQFDDINTSDDIAFIDTIVFDSNDDGGLDSHAVVFQEADDT